MTAPDTAMNTATSVRQKIVPLEELAARVKAGKAAGKTVVYAHGVFDLLHLGHVRHLEAARREGSMLVVTVTPDRFVNKGPGRPVFGEHLRAEMLAALVYVDAVAINTEPTAETALRLIQPDIYVKGVEYADAGNDLTGKISAEQAAVEEGGGRIVFTDEETYSSSTLINRHFSHHDPSLRSYLENFRTVETFETLQRAIAGLQDLKVLVIGDTIIDEYQYVTALGRPSKETIIATQFKNREVFAGGAVAAANHVASFCSKVELITSLGETESYEELVRNSLQPNVILSHVVRPGPTTRKCRFVDMGYSLKKLFEVYDMDDTPLPPGTQDAFNRLLAEKIPQYDVVVITDFGHGLLHGATVDLICRTARFLAVNTQTNSANHGFNVITKYPRADYICLDGPEARLAVGDKYAEPEDLVRRMPEIANCKRVIITVGKNGCMAYDLTDPKSAAAGIRKVPALTSTIVDTVGAGDAFFAVTAPLAFKGLPLETVALLGNVAGAMKVGIVGHRTPVERVPFLKFLTTLLK